MHWHVIYITVPLIWKCQHKFLQLGYVWLRTLWANVVWTCDLTVICLVVHCTETSKLGCQFSSMSNAEAYAFVTSVQSSASRKALSMTPSSSRTPWQLPLCLKILNSCDCNHALCGCTTQVLQPNQACFGPLFVSNQAKWFCSNVTTAVTCFDMFWCALQGIAWGQANLKQCLMIAGVRDNLVENNCCGASQS
jgi:hypothetical protein